MNHVLCTACTAGHPVHPHVQLKDLNLSNGLDDNDGQCVDIEIVDVVLKLNALGARTFEGCQGDTMDQTPKETHATYLAFLDYQTVPKTFIAAMRTAGAERQQLRYLESGLDDGYSSCRYGSTPAEIIAANARFHSALQAWLQSETTRPE